MELYDEIDEFHQLLLEETSSKHDCDLEGYQNLESKYSSLHESYSKEIENSKKVEKCLVKCLKFYSKLSKKYEAQQKVIVSLEQSIKEKVHSLEESLKAQEKLKGLVEVYRTERILYSGVSHESLRKDKEVLLDICCKLISESVKTNNVRNLANLILRKFKKDLDNEKKINLLKLRDLPMKKEAIDVKEWGIPSLGLKPCKLDWKYEDEKINLSNESKTWNFNKDDYDIEVKTESKEESLKGSCNKLNNKEKCNTSNDKENSTKITIQENGRLHNEGNSNILEKGGNCNVLITQENCTLNCIENSTGVNNVEKIRKLNEVEKHSVLSKEGNCNFSNKEKSAINNKICSVLNINSNSPILSDKSKTINNEKITSPNKEGDCSVSNQSSGLINNENVNINVERNLSVLNSKENCTKSNSKEKLFETNKKEYIQNLNNDSSCSNKEENDNLLKNKETCNLLNESEETCNQPGKNILNTKEGNLLNIEDNNYLFGCDMDDYCNESRKEEDKELYFFSEITKKTNSEINSAISNSKETVKISIDKGSKSNNDITEELTIQTDTFTDTNKTRQPNANNNEEIALTDEELMNIFKEITVVRMLSPIREINYPHRSQEDSDLLMSKRILGKRRNSFSKSSNPENKKLKSSGTNGGLLDSIMSAMSQQKEVFKCNVNKNPGFIEPEPSLEVVKEIQGNPDPVQFFKNEADGEKEKPTTLQPENLKENSSLGTTLKSEKAKSIEKLVMEELKSYVCLPMFSKEDADKYMKKCILVLSNKPEEIIAKSIVAIVFENVDENIEVFERPAPPLTKTQHRLVVLLSVFKTLECNSEKICSKIQSIIWEKFFPDKFFWPDDCIETATRFYTALCKMRNDMKTQWKFCLQAMTEMKQRCCLVVFTALKTWPDFLHNAATLQNNILAVTVVNVFLHMPKTDKLKNFNQKKKLLALKHLLINFYQFKVEDTIESFTQKVFQLFYKEESGAEKALVLLAKCRDWNWTCKNILTHLKKTLKEWTEEKIEDCIGQKILSVVKQISVIFINGKENASAQAKEIILCLSGALSSRRLTHATEQNIIELLIQMKQYPDARTVIREWVPQAPISENLRNEIINVSSENILRELKINKKKGTKKKSKKKKSRV